MADKRSAVVVQSAFACAIACLIAIATAASANAAVRYAEPGGDGSPTSCLQSDPCGIEPAIEAAQVADADEVILLPGTYDLGTGRIVVDDAINIHPRDAGTRPTITGTGNSVISISDAATIRDLNLVDTSTTGTGIGASLLLGDPGALAERLVLNATTSRTAIQNTQFGCIVNDGTLRDSFCHVTATGSNGFGVAAGSTPGASGGTHRPSFINVTAWGTKTGSANGVNGLNVQAAEDNARVEAIARNVIARPASGNAVIVSATNAGSHASLTLTNSNFLQSAVQGNATATAAGSATNQTAAPLLSNPDAGDFHELSGSPTIDAGAADALLGTQDLDFTPRTQGPAPDIGADEFFVQPTGPTGPTDPDPTPDTTAPETQIASGPTSGKTKKKKMPFSVTFSATEPATFTCSLDGAAPTTCTSPYGGKVGKGSHDFEVTATDSAGNVDPTPATSSWKVKRKKPKHHHHHGGGHHS